MHKHLDNVETDGMPACVESFGVHQATVLVRTTASGIAIHIKVPIFIAEILPSYDSLSQNDEFVSQKDGTLDYVNNDDRIFSVLKARPADAESHSIIARPSKIVHVQSVDCMGVICVWILLRVLPRALVCSEMIIQ